MLKADDTRYADADHIALTNNELLHQFSSLKLTLAGQEVEHVNSPGHATTLLGLTSYSTTYTKGCGLVQGCYPDTKTTATDNNVGFTIRQKYLIQTPDPKSSFQCAIPMKHIFGFMDDYSKVTYGMRDTLQLIRKAVGVAKVKLSKIAWSVPIVQPNDVRKVNLYNSIASNNVIPVSLRMRQCETFTVPQATSTVWQLGVSYALEKPRCVVGGLQTDKSGSQVRNAAIFDHCNLTNMLVWLDHSRYPSLDMTTDFAKEQFAGVYKSFYIQTTFSPPQHLQANRDYELAMVILETYYSFANIRKDNNSAKWSVDEGKTWTVIHVPTGCYELKVINAEITRIRGNSNITILPNVNTLQCILTVVGAKCKVSFDVPNSLASVLGFKQDIVYGVRWHASEKPVNIMSVNSILVHCNIIHSSYMRGIQAPVVYKFFPNAAPGQRILEAPHNLIYLPVTVDVISTLSVWLTMDI